ncbi:MAG: hypothetical protein K1X66_03405 [Verrucomicrobiae bacterium]|nr:hypothetical protein [Verrucomicrobiae bacterium]
MNNYSQHDGLNFANEITLDYRDFILDSKGICFTSHCPFNLYSEVVVTVELPQEQVDLKGIVVGCQKNDIDPVFDITLFFHEQSPALQKNIKIASRYITSAKAQPELLAAA